MYRRTVHISLRTQRKAWHLLELNNMVVCNRDWCCTRHVRSCRAQRRPRLGSWPWSRICPYSSVNASACICGSLTHAVPSNNDSGPTATDRSRAVAFHQCSGPQAGAVQIVRGCSDIFDWILLSNLFLKTAGVLMFVLFLDCRLRYCNVQLPTYSFQWMVCAAQPVLRLEQPQYVPPNIIIDLSSRQILRQYGWTGRMIDCSGIVGRRK